MITIDHNLIELGIAKGTLNQAQCNILRIDYPLVDGWESLLIGKEITQKDQNLFLFLRGDLSQKAQKQIVKNYQLVADFHKQKRESTKQPKEQKSHNVSISGEVEIYCDGACKGNPGKAGSGLAIYSGESKPTLLYGEYEAKGTNNTAELNALYKALLLASESPKSTIYSDSKYSIDCITKWAYGWKSRSWTKKGGEIKNLEIIKLSHELYEQIKDKTTIKHVKGHAGVEGNELADRMAVWAIASEADDGYQRYEYQNIDDVLGMSVDG